LPLETLSAFDGEGSSPLVREALATERACEEEAVALADALHREAGPAAEGASPSRHAVLRLRRAIHNRRPIRLEDLDAARAGLPEAVVARVRSFRQLEERRSDRIERAERAIGEDLLRARKRLLPIASDPLVAHGIHLGSRSLFPEIGRLSAREPATWSHGERHAASKIAAYLTRFATKTSPNGVFCAVSLAWLDGTRAVLQGEPGTARVDVLISIAEARKITACLATDPSLSPRIVPRPNPTLRESNDGITFWRPASPRNPTNEEVLSRVKDHPLLRMFLEEAGQAHPLPRLLDRVASRAEISRDDAERFYGSLVARGVLIGEVEIPHSCRRPLRALAIEARKAGSGADWVGTLEAIEAAVDRLPGLPVGARSSTMEELSASIESLPHVRPLASAALFRVDAASSLCLTLPDRLTSDLFSAMRVYALLLAGMYPEQLHHEALVSRFRKEHPADQDVEFLDLYRGFVDSQDEEGRPIEFPEPRADQGDDPATAAAVFTARRVRDFFERSALACATGASLEIDETTVRSLVGEVPPPRWACGVLFQVAARDLRDIEEGRYSLVVNSLFHGIGLALSRFSHLLGGEDDDPENPIVRELRRSWGALTPPGAVLAELTYNHDTRTANAGLRPILFEHEIELPGDRCSARVRPIPLADLTIRHDGASGRLVLRSRSAGVEVVPVLSSGVNPVGIVSDLIHIGRQGWQTMGYLPGFASDRVVRWPRIVVGRVVLFRARWVLRGASLPAVARARTPLAAAALFLEVARWRERFGLPRRVFVHTSLDPKPFHVDLESPLLVDVFRRTLLGLDDGTLFVTEMLPGPEDLFVRDERGRYAAELLVQLVDPGQA
jgi:hypothetical protein